MSTKGKARLPVSRITTIMNSSADAKAISKESATMLAKATELFINTLASEGYKLTNNGKKLDYKHISEVVNASEKYEFLRHIMPKKITVLEYKKIMAAKYDDDEDKTSSSSEDTDSSEEDSSEHNSATSE